MGFGFPDVLNVPAEKFLCGRGATNEEGERVVETAQLTLSDKAEVHELADGAGAEDVKHGQSEQPEGPGPDPATARFGRLRGGGLALVCKGLGHGAV
jgi:hypothetical protein